MKDGQDIPQNQAFCQKTDPEKENDDAKYSKRHLSLMYGRASLPYFAMIAKC